MLLSAVDVSVTADGGEEEDGYGVTDTGRSEKRRNVIALHVLVKYILGDGLTPTSLSWTCQVNGPDKIELKIIRFKLTRLHAI